MGEIGGSCGRLAGFEVKWGGSCGRWAGFMRSISYRRCAGSFNENDVLW